MKHCKYCNVDVDTNEKYCPLCYNNLEGENKKTKEFYLKRTENDKTQKTSYLISKIFLLITLASSAICLFINFVTDKTVLWSILVIICIIYIWILVAHTILSKRSIFEKILFQLAGIISIVVATNNIAKGPWLLNYVIPSIVLAASTILTFILFVTKKRAKLLSSFFLVYLLLFLTSLILVLVKADEFKLVNEINMITCGITIVGILLFGFKILKSDFSRKFHL